MNTLHHMKRFQWVAAFLALIMLGGASVSYAQTYTLTIRDGNVYVNGKMLPRDEIPASLDAESYDANLTFPSATFEFNGNYYKIENNKLLDVASEEAKDRTTVVFRNGPPAESNVSRDDEAAYGVRAESDTQPVFERRVYTSGGGAVAGDPNVVMQQYVIELTHNARQLNEMRDSFSQRQARDLVQQVQYQAEQAAQLAQDLPYLEMQNYFSAVRTEDELLYQRLVSELELEREAHRIADEIRQLPKGDAREFKVKELRELLSSILSLKQENRQMEIDQLEKQLAILKQRFADREAKKDRMIDRRIKELIGDPR